MEDTGLWRRTFVRCGFVTFESLASEANACCKPPECLTRRLAAGRLVGSGDTSIVSYPLSELISVIWEVFSVALAFFFLHRRCSPLPVSSPQFLSSLRLVIFQTREGALLNIINNMYQITNIYALAAFGTIGGALFGFDVSSMSAWIDRDQYLEYFNHPNSNMQGGVRVHRSYHPNPTKIDTKPPLQITASMSAGSFIGALCAGFIADKWGRRYALMGAAVVWIIGAAIQCSSQNVGHLIAGRIVSGLSVGVTSSQVCVYLAELAPGRIRGRIVGLQQWSIEWGILIMFLVAYGCTSVAGPAAFRIAWGVQAIPGFVLFGALIFFPESPRWLAGQERWEECLGVLAAIHAKGDRDDPLVQAEYLEVQEAVRVMQEAKGVGFLELFGPKVWKVSGQYAPALDVHRVLC
jgi:hypothetical protein